MAQDVRSFVARCFSRVGGEHRDGAEMPPAIHPELDGPPGPA